MRKSVLIAMVLGLVLLFAVSAAPALACDDYCGCECRSPGYWMNHPEAWPDGVTVGGMFYTTDEAVALMGMPGGDKSITMFRAVAAANLNLAAGCYASCCMRNVIDAANAWMAEHPAGSGVKARSCAWQDGGECLYWKLDAWNNGW